MGVVAEGCKLLLLPVLALKGRRSHNESCMQNRGSAAQAAPRKHSTAEHAVHRCKRQPLPHTAAMKFEYFHIQNEPKEEENTLNQKRKHFEFYNF
jgi:hypothetical protein